MNLHEGMSLSNLLKFIEADIVGQFFDRFITRHIGEKFQIDSAFED